MGKKKERKLERKFEKAMMKKVEADRKYNKAANKYYAYVLDRPELAAACAYAATLDW